ncbi:MAG: hypothetical protein IT436_07790 [Phycisphaerales bacterium]|nr:hypothetical protein [Phycisphaerales bacterium]
MNAIPGAPVQPISARPSGGAPAGYRTLAWLIAAIAAIAMGLSAWAVAGRVANYHRQRPRETYAFQALNLRQFDYAGRPVTLTDSIDPASGESWLNVDYAGEKLRLRATIPGDPRLPGLVAHNDWLRVLRFTSATGLGVDELRRRMESGELRDRLVLVTRTPEPGSDPHSRGEVNRKAWVFDFYELRAEGGFDHQRLAFPTRKRPSLAQLMKGETPAPDHGVLQQNTWQFQAAQMVMPPARGPTTNFTEDAIHAVGWTMAAFTVSTLICITAVLIAVAPARRRAASV